MFCFIMCGGSWPWGTAVFHFPYLFIYFIKIFGMFAGSRLLLPITSNFITVTFTCNEIRQHIYTYCLKSNKYKYAMMLWNALYEGRPLGRYSSTTILNVNNEHKQASSRTHKYYFKQNFYQNFYVFSKLYIILL